MCAQAEPSDLSKLLATVDQDDDGEISFEEVMIYLLVPLGGFLGVLGVYMTLSGA